MRFAQKPEEIRDFKTKNELARYLAIALNNGILQMKIQILHNKPCNFWMQAKKILEEILYKKGIANPIEEILIENDIEAAKWHFAGSPQIMINGKDIDPLADKIKNFHESGCRFYFWKDEVYEYPPRAMILEAIEKYVET